MNEKQAKARAEKLKKEINDLRYRYHVLDDPAVSDDVYDSLTRELVEIEQEFPQIQTVDSPTQRIGGKPLEKFEKVKHIVPMLSLNDAFNKEDLEAWEKRIKKLLPADSEFDYFTEVKLDGLAVSLIYEDGNLARGATRGDGLIGEDITENLKTVHSIPLRLRKPHLKLLEVRGEAVMSKDVLKMLNKRQEKEGKPLFANTRNAAAGSLRQLDPKLAAKRHLDFFAYDIAQIDEDKAVTRHSKEHELLRIYGFKVDSHEKVVSGLNGVFQRIDKIEKLRKEFDYGTDGVVVSVDDMKFYERLGVVGKAPRFMIAYKYPAEKATTRIKDIVVNVGRTGALTPLGIFEPTLVAGSAIFQAAFHNMDMIEQKDIRTGDTAVIQKAGDVIPEVVESLPRLRTGKERKFHMPKSCPVCGGKVEQRQLGTGKSISTAYYCSNPKCPAKNQRFMQHFVNALEIYTIGPKILQRLKDEGLISDAADLFTLKKEDVASLERFGEKSAENIINSIQEHKKVSFPRFIMALGILHVGEQTAFDLAEAFGTLNKLRNASLEELNTIENIGDVVAKSVYDFFRDPQNQKFIDRLLERGVKVQSAEKVVKSQKLKGLKIIVTGTLETLSRDEAKKLVMENGGDWVSSVSKNTDFLVVGDNPGSKLDKAEKLGVKIIDEQQFLKILNK